jgi:hypothetical protein
MAVSSYRIRIFLTCWVIFALHFATDFVREHYLVLSIGDNFSFQLAGYEGLHADIFTSEEHGTHHGANPGASLVAVVPYLVFKPAIDAIDRRVQAGRAAAGDDLGAVYDDPRPNRVKFFRQVRERGLDIKFGLTGLVTQVFCMAPLSALSAVVIFSIFVWLGLTSRLSMWLALLYAVGTPVFFRTGFLNQNIMVGIFTLFAFVLLWQPYRDGRLGLQARYALAGFFGGMCFLCDYSGAILTGLLGLYGLVLRMENNRFMTALGESLWYGAGALLPALMLWFYQYQSFGHPFYPPQHYMPPVAWIDIGYQGVGVPQWELLNLLWFDHGYGLFVVGPLLALALLAPVLAMRGNSILGMREIVFILLCFLAVSIFFSGVQYTRLQFNTGIRYLMAIVPLLYIPAAVVLIRMPRWMAFPLIVLVIAESWAIAMVRSHYGVEQSLMHVFLGGFQLPWLETLSRMAANYIPFLEGQRVSALPFMALAASLVYGIWRIGAPGASLSESQHESRASL